MSTALRTHGLLKRRGDFTLGPLDLDLDHGLVTALFGPNGAGKTTLLDLIAGLLTPDGGHLHLHDDHVTPTAPHWKATIGYVSEHQPFFERWSGARNLAFLRTHYPTWSDELATTLARRLDLPLTPPARTLSKGNRLKLALIAALAHRPTVLLLDEPTSGLDPLARTELHSILYEHLEQDTPTILYSTHILSDVTRLADRFLFLRNGRLILTSDRDALTESWRLFSAHTPTTPASLTNLPGVKHVQPGAHGHLSILTDDPHATRLALGALGVTVHDVTRPALDDIVTHILKSSTENGDRHVAARPR